jgi:hypothetical protein
MIPTTDFITLLKAHDWGFESLRDAPYDRGRASQRKLLYLCQQQPELFRLYNHALNRFIRSLPFDFQSVPGTLPGKDEKQHTHTNTMTNELFKSFFDISVKPLVDAINNLATGALGAPPPQPETPAPVVEKPAKAKATKAAAPAPAPAPEPEPEQPEQPEQPAITEIRLRETVKTLPNEGKAKLKAYFVKKFGYNTMAEIAPEHYADIHAAAVKIGAVDTDPDAQTEEVDLG